MHYVNDPGPNANVKTRQVVVIFRFKVDFQEMYPHKWRACVCLSVSVCECVYMCVRAKGNASLQIDHHSSTGKDRGGVSEWTLTQPIMNKVVIMRNPLPLNRGHWSNAPPVYLILCLACIAWSRVSNSFPSSLGRPAPSSVCLAVFKSKTLRVMESSSCCSSRCRCCQDESSNLSSIRNNCELEWKGWV